MESVIKRLAVAVAGLCGALLLIAVSASCSADNDDKNYEDGDFRSAAYRISGRVVDGGETGLDGIRVVMNPENGVTLNNGKKNETTTDRQGNFVVEVLSSNIKGDIFVLEFADPRGEYDVKTVNLPLQDVEFTDGDGALYLGYYATRLKADVVMTPKGGVEDGGGEAE